MELTLQELMDRRTRFILMMERRFPDWDTAVIINTVNQYYFTGTMQDGILFIYKDGSCLYGVRRSFQRAQAEFLLSDQELLPISTYRDMAAVKGAQLGNVYIEGDTMPVLTLERLKKYFEISSVNFLDSLIRKVRSVKSPYELYWITCSGEMHRKLLEEQAPALLREGMSEAEFTGALISEMYKLGYQGLTRFHQFQAELGIGQIGFGTNALYPARFEGPGGSRGNCPASPLAADNSRRLKKGDPVFVDIGFGMEGYHSDKTQVYFFGGPVPEAFEQAHRFCMDLEKRLAEQLQPGAIPSQLYADLIGSIPEELLDCFMGTDNDHRVKFLGHGIGLTIDEFPVIARGFDDPLEENMVLALEPKKGVPGIGMAGVEDTYIVKSGGGQSVTGGGRPIILV